LRAFLSIALISVFAACFTAYVVGAAMVDHLEDTEAVVEASRRGDMHGLVVDVLEASLGQELERSSDPLFRAMVGAALRSRIHQVMSEEWFYGTLKVAYGGFAEVLAGRTGRGSVDLGPRIEELRRRLYELGDRALAQCQASPQAAACRSDAGALVQAYRTSVDTVLRSIPAQTSLAAIIDDLGSRFLPPRLAKSRAMGSSVRLARLLRIALGAVLVVMLLVLMAVQGPPLARRLRVAGIAVVVAAALALALSVFASSIADDVVHEEFARELSDARIDPVVAVAMSGSERVLRAQLSSALGHYERALWAWLAGGGVVVVGALALGARRS